MVIDDDINGHILASNNLKKKFSQPLNELSSPFLYMIVILRFFFLYIFFLTKKKFHILKKLNGKVYELFFFFRQQEKFINLKNDSPFLSLKIMYVVQIWIKCINLFSF